MFALLSAWQVTQLIRKEQKKSLTNSPVKKALHAYRY